MKSVRRSLIYVLLLALPLSSWAGSVVPCAQESAPLPIQEVVAGSDHARHSNRHHEPAAPDQDAASRDCSCCGDCSTMCPSSGSTPAVITSKLPGPSCAGDHQENMLVDLIYTTLIPFPLFRPPIAVS